MSTVDLSYLTFTRFLGLEFGILKHMIIQIIQMIMIGVKIDYLWKNLRNYFLKNYLKCVLKMIYLKQI